MYTTPDEIWFKQGDVNVFEHGATFIKRVGATEFFCYYFCPETHVFGMGNIDTSESWIKEADVLSFVGEESAINPPDFAFAALSYYDKANFFSTNFNLDSKEELETTLAHHGIPDAMYK